MTTSAPIRSSSRIRQDFFDFFKSKQHTIVPSSSLLPDSPNLLFTNAGMNQFVPIFLGRAKCPYQPGRAADTQKCIRAGGKHNDLEDVGLDTYHHTFFEMLGNWSFGDYFKAEAIDWAWELVTKVWKFPKERLYATIYNPDKSQGDPSERDEEAWNCWAEKFRAAGLDPAVHIVYGGKQDNFWMMGDTGPCGPCSELHVDLTPGGNTNGSLVNKDDARCIEIWNLVFIQFNANPDGTFSPLPAKHVDTGMGFERVTAIIQGTKNFKDFASAKISNYETDIFRPIFDALEKLSGKKYGSTLPKISGSATVPVVSVGVPPMESPAPRAADYKRRLPHFEHPWAKYMVNFSTRERQQLSPKARDIVLKSLLFGHEQRRYQLYAACVMPDHVHFLFEPQIKERDKDGKPVFWPVTEILQAIKSFTAHEINKAEGTKGQVWENESFDWMIRSDADLEEKFHYICRNPWDSGVVPITENYQWLWTPDAAARDAQQNDRDGRAPQNNASHSQKQIQTDIAFRVIADHIRTLGFAIADGIQPSNEGRGYVLRRILRRAVRYGRTLGFHEPFFYKLVDVLADTMGDVFPEIRARKKQVQETIRIEEEAFNKTLDEGSEMFENALAELAVIKKFLHKIPSELEKVRQRLNDLLTSDTKREDVEGIWAGFSLSIRDPEFTQEAIESLVALPAGSARKIIVTKQIVVEWAKEWRDLLKPVSNLFRELEKLAGNQTAFATGQKKILNAIAQLEDELPTIENKLNIFPGRVAFKLYDTYGFPLDLTELMARERGLTVDKEGFEKLMEEQRARARTAQKKEVVSVSQIETTTPTKFVGYEKLETPAKVLEVVSLKGKTAVILDTSACYAEMGGQVGDTGELTGGGWFWRIINTQKSGNTWLHFISDAGAAEEIANRKSQIVNLSAVPAVGAEVTLTVEKPRRSAIERHHTVTHLLHWALHEVVSRDASQKGSFVGPDKLTFDFNSAPLMPQQVADVEKLVNERILENAGVSWTEVPYADVKSRKDVMQFFGEKYGDTVRVVQIGGHAKKLDGYSMELCGGTHTRATGEIGLFRIVGENAIAAGVRRIEAVAGLEAYRQATDELQLIKSLAGKVNSPLGELEKKIEALLEHQKTIEKQLRSAQQREASNAASRLLEEIQKVNDIPVIIHNLGVVDGDFLQAVADSLKERFKGVIVLGGGPQPGNVALVAAVTPDFIWKIQAGKIMQQIAPIVGGKGGGRPDNARGGGKDAAKLDEALAKVKTLLG